MPVVTAGRIMPRMEDMPASSGADVLDTSSSLSRFLRKVQDHVKVSAHAQPACRLADDMA